MTHRYASIQKLTTQPCFSDVPCLVCISYDVAQSPKHTTYDGGPSYSSWRSAQKKLSAVTRLHAPPEGQSESPTGLEGQSQSVNLGGHLPAYGAQTPRGSPMTDAAEIEAMAMGTPGPRSYRKEVHGVSMIHYANTLFAKQFSPPLPIGFRRELLERVA